MMFVIIFLQHMYTILKVQNLRPEILKEKKRIKNIRKIKNIKLNFSNKTQLFQFKLRQNLRKESFFSPPPSLSTNRKFYAQLAMSCPPDSDLQFTFHTILIIENSLYSTQRIHCCQRTAYILVLDSEIPTLRGKQSVAMINDVFTLASQLFALQMHKQKLDRLAARQ